jgi:uncharacterized protein (DUF305 family)
MEKHQLYWIIAVLAILVVAMGAVMIADAMEPEDHSMTMDSMVQALEGKEGDAFDKAFIDHMIPHHQGAVDMAKLAVQYAGHQEIKDMAQDIIDAQNAEISQMHNWYQSWGYGAHYH